jgi:hypothetical protein
MIVEKNRGSTLQLFLSGSEIWDFHGGEFEEYYRLEW